MKQALFMASAVALAFTASPALAKPGNGNGKHAKHGERHDARDDRRYRDDRRDRDDRRYSRAGYGCPPGLAKKNNGCLPPGQAKKLARGQRYVTGYGYDRYSYDRLPYDLRRQYDLDRDNRYYYDDGTLYGVDPKTMIIEQVISALLR